MLRQHTHSNRGRVLTALIRALGLSRQPNEASLLAPANGVAHFFDRAAETHGVQGVLRDGGSEIVRARESKHLTHGEPFAIRRVTTQVVQNLEGDAPLEVLACVWLQQHSYAGLVAGEFPRRFEIGGTKFGSPVSGRAD